MPGAVFLPEVGGDAFQAWKVSAVIRHDQGGEARVLNARAFDITIAVIGLSRVGVDLADHL